MGATAWLSRNWIRFDHSGSPWARSRLGFATPFSSPCTIQVPSVHSSSVRMLLTRDGSPWADCPLTKAFPFGRSGLRSRSTGWLGDWSSHAGMTVNVARTPRETDAPRGRPRLVVLLLPIECGTAVPHGTLDGSESRPGSEKSPRRHCGEVPERSKSNDTTRQTRRAKAHCQATLARSAAIANPEVRRSFSASEPEHRR
jgi:hypothetical protein